MNSISVENLSAGYGSVQVLEGISLSVNDGETVTLLGTNGNGKSTLMKCIMGLVRPDRGRLSLTLDGAAHDLTRLSPEAIEVPTLRFTAAATRPISKAAWAA